jgi:hypothetical protein
MMAVDMNRLCTDNESESEWTVTNMFDMMIIHVLGNSFLPQVALEQQLS